MKSIFDSAPGLEEKQSSPSQDWQLMVQMARDIVAKRNKGEEISSEEKEIVLEVVNEAVKGMSIDIEKELDKRAQKINRGAAPQKGPASQPGPGVGPPLDPNSGIPLEQPQGLQANPNQNPPDSGNYLPFFYR